MAWAHLVILGALIEYFVFAWMVAKARVKYGVHAPATSGHEVFDRYFRVQQNTLELLILFVPSMWIACAYFEPEWVAGVGAVYVIGRIVYMRGYVSDPKSRHSGFMLSLVPIAALILGALFGVVRALIQL
ncbi:MAG: MAPEG family protein [Rudaea sp.]